METLILNGKTYVKASKAARDLGYTADYVGQLCRSGSVDAHLVGRTWYVHADKLGEHRVEKKRMSRVKAREQAHKSIEEHKKKAAVKSDNNYNSVAIRYESDDRELMPAVRKVSITTQEHVESPVVDDSFDGAPYEVLNAGEKVQMSGKLKIVDASDDVPDADTTLLEPKFIRKKKVFSNQIEKDQANVMIHEIEDGVLENPGGVSRVANDRVKTSTKMSFMERLQINSELHETTVAVEDTNTVSEKDVTTVDTQEEFVVPTVSYKENKTSSVGWVLTLLSVCILAVGTICVEVEYRYVSKDREGNTTFDTIFYFDKTSVVTFLRSKI